MLGSHAMSLITLGHNPTEAASNPLSPLLNGKVPHSFGSQMFLHQHMCLELLHHVMALGTFYCQVEKLDALQPKHNVDAQQLQLLVDVDCSVFHG